MGYVDPLGRFIRDPDVDSLDNLSSSHRKTPSNPIQFLSNLMRHDQDELVRFGCRHDPFVSLVFHSRQKKKPPLDSPKRSSTKSPV